MLNTTHRTDKIEGSKQFGHTPSGGKWKQWARKSANKASRKAAKLALRN